MAQWIKVLVAKPDSLSLILRTHTVEERATPTSCPLTYTSMVCTDLYLQKQTNLC